MMSRACQCTNEAVLKGAAFTCVANEATEVIAHSSLQSRRPQGPSQIAYVSGFVLNHASDAIR